MSATVKEQIDVLRRSIERGLEAAQHWLPGDNQIDAWQHALDQCQRLSAWYDESLRPVEPPKCTCKAESGGGRPNRLGFVRYRSKLRSSWLEGSADCADFWKR